ncbi:NADH-quinone oxidoreductase subunit F, partial [Myxococcota bacterium]|nr:NADH-quinone oxidoreductase subunit F [Myxococcota bacterium]
MAQATPSRPKLIVGLGTCGIAAGAEKVYNLFKNKLEAAGSDVELSITGCNGMCHNEPIAEFVDAQGNTFLYGALSEKKAELVFDKHIVGGTPMDKFLLHCDDDSTGPGKFNAKQRKIVLRNCGVINPESLEEYLAVSGYEGLKKAMEKGPDWIVQEVKDSGLRGRGGAGFSTGMKWMFTQKAVGEKKYIICNADEGDPGAFMDRSVLESDPHSVLEGMAVCAFATGASFGYIYCRAEYPLA